MKILQRTGAGRSAPAGLEWRLWRRLPAILMWGLILLGATMAWAWWQQPALTSAAEERAFWLLIYRLAGAMLLHGTLVFTLAVGCAVVMVMKGPAFTADSYPLPDKGRT